MVVGAGRADAAGLWIDFLLLPEQLEEHLERLRSGAASSPTHAELINMFLDQALSSYKLARKEPESQGASSSPRSDSNRTSTLLCERAVRVVLAAGLKLSDMESLVPRHLPMILKALVKFDRPRSLLHECDLRRWILHRALAPESLAGSTTTSSITISNNKSPSISSTPPPSSSPPAPPAPGSESSSEFSNLFQVESGAEEGSAVAFLENVLEREKVGGEGKQVNGVVRFEPGLEPGFVCQILFDVAEAHFMRGRIKRASELFTRCGEIISPDSNPEPVPRDRLNGFIVACRSITGSGALQSGSANASQEVVFTCEKSRVFLKRKSEDCNGVPDRVKLLKPTTTTATATAAAAAAANGGIEAEHKSSSQPPNGYPEESSKNEEDLVRVLVEDLGPRRLSWPYCLSLESDGSIPASVRLRISACNVLRKVLEGGAFESFLRIGYRVEEESREAGVFLLELMGRVVELQSELGSRVRQFCVYVCRALGQSWCWKLAVENKLVSPELAVKLRGFSYEDSPLEVRGDTGRGTGLATLDILQAESLTEVERAVATGQGDVAGVVRVRAFHALERQRDSNLARQLYSLARSLGPGSIDTEILLWFLERTGSEVATVELPEKLDGCDRPSPGVVEYAFVKLLEARHWALVRELCVWADEKKLSESREVGFIFREAGVLGALLPLCGESSGRNSDEILIKLEELMELIKREAGFSRWFFVGSEKRARLPIISKLSSVEALEALENLVAGWISSSASSSSSPLVELVRYNSLAQLASGSKTRDAESGKKVFEALLQRLLKLPRAPEEEIKRGCRCFLGLADLAFVDEAYVEALQLYLQAGAMRSSFYCDRVTSMARELFTPWVITRMITACKEIGAQIQAAILCQCLPDPDYESAFQILLANPLIVDHDAALYFECVWEIPLLELLLNMHAKAGDRSRVSNLIGILQQPALNVHNPASIRKAHIAAMEQRFLQRFYAELM